MGTDTTNSNPVFVCTLGELPSETAREFTLGTGDDERACFLVRRGDTVRAYENSCPHTGSSLNWGPDKFLTRDRNLIMCSVHGALFEIDDGYCIAGPCQGRHLTELPVEVSEDRIYVVDR